MLFLGFQAYLFIKYKGNVLISINFESAIKSLMDISVLMDDEILIHKTIEDNECIMFDGNRRYFIIADENIFVKPGKHTITIESKKRKLKKVSTINVYFFKYITVSYSPHFSQFIEEIDEYSWKSEKESHVNILNDYEPTMEGWDEEKFEIWENCIPIPEL